MDARQAEEQLTTIRTLLERATVYRALSVPGAALAGVLAGLGAAFGCSGGSGRFLMVWMSVLAAAAVANTLVLARQARTDGRPLFSPGLRLALRGLWPPMLAGGFIGILFAMAGHLEAAAAFWALFYGLSLLATREFAPRSICRLGHAFTLAGLFGVGAAWDIEAGAFAGGAGVPAPLFLAATFCAFHLIYAALVFPATRRVAHD